MKSIFLLSLLAVGSLAVTTIELLAGDKYNRYSTLVGYIVKVNLIEAMNNGDFTLFAPSNTDFQNLQYSPDYNSSLLTDTTQLRQLLAYHVTNTTILNADMKNDMIVTMADGKQARFNVYSNGNGWTTKTINGRVITETDNIASNGVVHMVDAVVFPPVGDIIQILESNPKLSILLGLIRTAGLLSELQAEARTLFAPCDDAFKQLDGEIMNKLMTNTTLLTNVLKYHVIGSTQYLQAFLMKSQNSVPSLLNGEPIQAQMSFSGLMVDVFATVTTPDISATNGVVHIIDHVLIPHSQFPNSLVG